MQFDLQDGSFDFSSILDPSAFQLDLSDLDLSDIDMSDVELPDMDALDLSQLFADMDLSVSEDALQSLMKKIMNGYKRYIIGNGILNLDKIGFSSYMESDQFKQLLFRIHGRPAGHHRPAGAVHRFAAAEPAGHHDELSAKLLGTAEPEAWAKLCRPNSPLPFRPR